MARSFHCRLRITTAKVGIGTGVQAAKRKPTTVIVTLADMGQRPPGK